MLFAIMVIFGALWSLGLVTSYTMGGLIHVLWVVAIVVVLTKLIQGRNMLGRKGLSLGSSTS